MSPNHECVYLRAVCPDMQLATRRRVFAVLADLRDQFTAQVRPTTCHRDRYYILSYTRAVLCLVSRLTVWGAWQASYARRCGQHHPTISPGAGSSIGV